MKQKYSFIEAAFHNALLLHFEALEFQIENKTCMLRYLPNYPQFTPQVSLALDMLQQPIIVDVFNLNFLSLHPHTSEIDNFNVLPEELKQALAECIFEEPLKAFTKKFDLPVSFLTLANNEQIHNFISFAFMFTFAENEIPLFIHFTHECLQELLSKLKELPPKKTDISHILLPCSIEVATLKLSISEINSIEVGDVLIPDFLSHVGNEKSALFYTVGIDEYNNLPAFLCTIKDKTLSFIQTYSLKQETSMLEEEMTQENQQENQANFNDLKVKLSFELERRMMTLEELQNLQVGTNILLNTDVTSPVTLIIADKQFAKARVVEIDDKYAVQITEILINKD